MPNTRCSATAIRGWLSETYLGRSRGLIWPLPLLPEAEPVSYTLLGRYVVISVQGKCEAGLALYVSKSPPIDHCPIKEFHLLFLPLHLLPQVKWS